MRTLEKIQKASLIAVSLLVVPFGTVSAESVCAGYTKDDLRGLVCAFMTVANRIVPLLVTVAVVAFIWGVIKFIYNGGDSKAHTDGRNLMIYGVIGIAVMLSMWGLALMVKNAFGF